MEKKLSLPTLRGKMGDFDYFVTLLKFKDVAERVSMVEEIDEIYRSKLLRKWIQRQLNNNRTKEIKQYLINQNQRFFNSLILGIHEGKPSWLDINVEINNDEIDLYEEDIININNSFGVLNLHGDEKIFAIDGQHRAKAIRDVVKNNEELSDKEVSVIFIEHKSTEEGLIKTRRLFTTLNRNAKPVTLAEIIALDEDDISAILTRQLIEEYKLFGDENISLTKSLSLSKYDYNNFTNIVTLYKCLDHLLPSFLSIKKQNWNKYKKNRPSEEIISNCREHLFKFWDKFIEYFPVLNEYLNQKDKANRAVKFRNKETGGNVLFRPVGLLLYIKLIVLLRESGKEIDETLNLIKLIDTRLNKIPWKNIIWESGTNKMITASENQNVALHLCLYMLDQDLTLASTTEGDLIKRYASILKKESHEVKLPKL